MLLSRWNCPQRLEIFSFLFSFDTFNLHNSEICLLFSSLLFLSIFGQIISVWRKPFFKSYSNNFGNISTYMIYIPFKVRMRDLKLKIIFIIYNYNFWKLWFLYISLVWSPEMRKLNSYSCCASAKSKINIDYLINMNDNIL